MRNIIVTYKEDTPTSEHEPEPDPEPVNLLVEPEHVGSKKTKCYQEFNVMEYVDQCLGVNQHADRTHSSLRVQQIIGIGTDLTITSSDFVFKAHRCVLMGVIGKLDVFSGAEVCKTTHTARIRDTH